MKNPNLIPIILIVLCLTSCNSTKHISSNIKPDEVTNIQPFETFSYISLIENGNKPILNDSLSVFSKNLFTEVIDSLKYQFPISGEIICPDSIQKTKLEQEIGELCIAANKSRNMSKLAIPPTIDSLLHEKGKRFGLISVTSGFLREKGNYGKQIAKGAAIGIASFGLYYQVPVKSNTTIYLIIVDAEKDNIIYSMKSVAQEKDPLDKKVLLTRANLILRKYFQPEQKEEYPL